MLINSFPGGGGSGSGVIYSYIVGTTPFAADWLSDSVGGAAITPDPKYLYIILTAGDYQNCYYRFNGTNYVSAMVITSETAQLAEDFNPSASYVVGKYVAYNDAIYRFKNPHSGAWSAADVDGPLLVYDEMPQKMSAADLQEVMNLISGAVLTNIPGCTPVGTIIAVMGTTAPSNYLKCEGQIVTIVDYPELATYFEEQFGSKNYFGGDGTTTFAIPDLRGEFLRGAGANAHLNGGTGGTVGTHQDATQHVPIISYDAAIFATKDISNKTESLGFNTVNKADALIYNGEIYRVFAGGTEQEYAESASVQTAKRYTSRPTNTSVLYCIAYKNIYIGSKLSEPVVIDGTSYDTIDGAIHAIADFIGNL